MTETRYQDVDAGVRELVARLNEIGITTLESCQGGPGHPYPAPWIRISSRNTRPEMETAVAQERRRILRLRRNQEIEVAHYAGYTRPRRSRQAAWNLWLEP